MNGRIQKILIEIILLALGCIFLVYWGTKKEVWFCDEIYTYESANGFEAQWPAEKVDVWQSGAEVEAYLAADWDTLSLNDITIRLYNDHVPLYFWIFRILSVYLFHGSASIWIGMTINIIFYLIILGVQYKVFYKLTGSSLQAAVISILTCMVNGLILSQATMLRMYMMLFTVEVLLLLTEIRFLKDVKAGTKPVLSMIFLFFIGLIGFLTHYHYWVFYAVTATVVCGWLMLQTFIKKGWHFWQAWEFRYVTAHVCNFAAALVMTTIIFPYCKWNLNKGKGQTALHSLVVFSEKKLEHIKWGYAQLSNSIFGDIIPVWLGLVLIFGCILSGIYIMYRNKQTDLLLYYILIVCICQLYQLIVCFTMPDMTEERYLWSSDILLLWCAAWGIVLLLQQKSKWLCAACGILLLILNIRVIDGGKGIDYLFHLEKDRQALELYSDCPWIVYGPTVGVYSYYDWIIPEQICFLTKEQTEADKAALLEKAQETKFIMYIYEDYHDEAISFLEETLGIDLESTYLMRSTNLQVFELRAVNK